MLVGLLLDDSMLGVALSAAGLMKEGYVVAAKSLSVPIIEVRLIFKGTDSLLFL